MNHFDTPQTANLERFLSMEGPEGNGRVVGLSIEQNGVFIYTDSSLWCDDSGAGTFRGDSESKAINNFYDRVMRKDYLQ